MNHYVHRPYNPNLTIAAVATPPGEGGVAVIRISGKEAFTVAQKVFSKKITDYPTHTAHFGKFRDEERTIDEGLLLIMRAPQSYTGENTIELHCHGGSLITQSLLQAVFKAGAVLAQPGEFTFRAFMNGKIDLAQAEAVQSLISAKNEFALSTSKEQLQGKLSKRISSFQKELIEIAAILEAWVDFPEEGLEFASQEEIIDSLKKNHEHMAHLLDTFHEGKMIHEGLTLCLAGSPNVGKSSLMNALLGKERAIVTDIAGTTRDLLEDHLRLGGLHFRLIDTAGIRQTEEIIEKEGIKRTLSAMKQADLVLLVMDASSPLNEEDKQLIAESRSKNTLLVWNKIDKGNEAYCQTHLSHVQVSAKLGLGLPDLTATIEKCIWKNGTPDREEIIITHLRHKEALSRAVDASSRLIHGLKEGTSPEFLSSEMRLLLLELGTIIGMDITEEILTSIFSKFCVGK